jgi:hypothetical protein
VTNLAREPSDDELRSRLTELIKVDHVLLARAKAATVTLVLDGGVTQGVPIVDRVVAELASKHPGKLPMHSALEFDWMRLVPYGEYYSARLAVCAAIWQLIHNSLLMMGHSGQVQLQRWIPTLDTDIPPGYSGSTRHIEVTVESVDV